MFTCRDANELITEDREGALSGWVRVRHRFHMTICPHCRAYGHQMNQVLTVAKEIPAPPVPETTEERALAAFREARKAGRSV
jgi:predicted anti-sigma-YlaC factor YlaD